MGRYKVAVTTGPMIHADSDGYALISLIGTEGESETGCLEELFYIGETMTCTVKAHGDLGKLLLLRLVKKPRIYGEDDWFCAKIEVTTPDKDVVHFPCYTWLSNDEEILLRTGEAKKVFEDKEPILISQREEEMETRRQLYRWKLYKEGLPYCIDAKTSADLPQEIQFSYTKDTDLKYSNYEIAVALGAKGLITDINPWDNLQDIKDSFGRYKTPVSRYLEDHWKEDEIFGYQFLNGCNPMLIQRCDQVPSNFAVTNEMVKPFLETGSSLSSEMQKGNIFLADFRRLDGLAVPIINGRQQYITAPLCLLYKNPEDKLVPIAIQLNQKPSADNPVFLPSDSEHDWLLAKLYVRNADFHEHQANAHYWRTHGLSEAFIVSTMRNLPMTHPLHKLLIPHSRYTLHINTNGRFNLFGPQGVYTVATNLGGPSQFELPRRWFSEVTYSSFCMPEDIRDRGLESIPNFYYRDDGLKIWDALHRYVCSMVEYYYPNDQEVQKDTELQAWIKDIFIHGFLGRTESGFPEKFETVKEVVKFVTMLIFNVSAQHAAVNSGQFDYGGWLPNSPNSMRMPPPTTKGKSTEQTIMDALPDIATTVHGAMFRWMLSANSTDWMPLGIFPDEHFCEKAPLKFIDELWDDLYALNNLIKERNKDLVIPYKYLCPDEVDNSTSI